MEIETLNKMQLENLQMAKEAENRLAMETLNVVEMQDLDLAKKIAELQLARKNLASSITQGKYNIRRIASDLRSVKIRIWQVLDEGQ